MMLHVRPRWLRQPDAVPAAANQLGASHPSSHATHAAGSSTAQTPTLEDLWHVQAPEPQVGCRCRLLPVCHGTPMEPAGGLSCMELYVNLWLQPSLFVCRR